MNKDELVEAFVNLYESSLDDHKDEYYINCRIVIDRYEDLERSYNVAFIDNNPIICIPENNDYEATYFKDLNDAKTALSRINIADLEEQVPMDYDYITCEIFQVEDEYFGISRRV